MIDLELVEYIRQNKGKYSIDQLKSGLLGQGVSELDIQEALAFINREESPDHEMVVDGYTAEDNTEDGDSLTGDSRFDFLKDARTKSFAKKCQDILYVILGYIGVKKQDKEMVSSVFSYGAVSFVMTTVIVTVFQYFAAIFVYPKIASDIGVFGRMSLPDIFLLSIQIGPLIMSLLWAAVIGSFGTYVFVRYLIRLWPFILVNGFVLKLALFYSLIHIIFGVFLGGVIISLKGIFILGYLMVAAGALGSSYLASLYFVNSFQQKNSHMIKDLSYKKW